MEVKKNINKNINKTKSRIASKFIFSTKNTVLFKPQWRGTNLSATGIPLSYENYSTVNEMTHEVNFFL